MKVKAYFCLFALSFFLPTALFSSMPNALAEEQSSIKPDKALSAKMIRFGEQSYERGNYLDAKDYFRKAVQADPSSAAAWRYYDRATIFALAKKVEKNASLIAPDVSPRAEEGHGKVIPSAPPPPQAGPAKKKAVVSKEDEGC